MKRFMLLIMMFVFMLGCLGCVENRNSADSKMRRATEKSMSEMQSQVGMPAIKNFQERKLAKMIFELRDQAKLITYTYIVTISGTKVFLGKSIGYGLPYSIQYTNPMKVDCNSSRCRTMPQADPNGLFMPSGLSATWVMLINPRTGKAKPVYIENEIIVSPFKL